MTQLGGREQLRGDMVGARCVDSSRDQHGAREQERGAVLGPSILKVGARRPLECVRGEELRAAQGTIDPLPRGDEDLSRGEQDRGVLTTSGEQLSCRGPFQCGGSHLRAGQWSLLVEAPGDQDLARGEERRGMEISSLMQAAVERAPGLAPGRTAPPC